MGYKLLHMPDAVLGTGDTEGTRLRPQPSQVLLMFYWRKQHKQGK